LNNFFGRDAFGLGLVERAFLGVSYDWQKRHGSEKDKREAEKPGGGFRGAHTQ
jgi:hypothetical protein